MTIVRELVTLLRYQVENSGLRSYAQQAHNVGRQVSGVGRAAMQGWREGTREALAAYGLVPGRIIQGIREQRRLNAATRGTVDAYGRLRNAQGRFVAGQRRAVRNVRELNAGYSKISGYVRTAVAALASIGTARLSDEWAGVEARVGLATDSIDDQRRSLERLYGLAQDNGQDYLATGDLFTAIQRNRKELELQVDQSLQLTDIVGKLMAIGGGSSSSQQAALVQLGQALGSGVLRGDELNSILEQAPRLAQGIADAFGVSVGQLRKLGSEGKLTSKELAGGLLKQSQSLNEEFERMPKTFGRGWTLIRNAWGRHIWQLNRATRASESFYVVSKLIAQNMVAIVKVGAMALLAASLTKLRPLALAALRPFLRMYAVLEVLRLIGDDVLTWLRGGQSVLGGLIGRSEQWRDELQKVKDVAEGIKNYFGDANTTLVAWLTKWTTLTIVAYGLWVMLKGPILLIAQAVGWIATGLATVLGISIGWAAVLVGGVIAATVLIIRHWSDVKRAGLELWQAFTEGAAQSWVEIKRSFQSMLDWFSEKGAWLKSLFADMAPDWLQSGASKVRGWFGPSPAAVQRGGGGVISSEDNRQTNITIQGVPGNPAAVGRAAEDGVRRGFGPAVPVVRPGPLLPNVEAMP